MSYEAFQALVLIVMVVFAIFSCILYFKDMKRNGNNKK